MTNLFINLVERQRAEFIRLSSLGSADRTASNQLESHLDSSLIKVITGPRRAGKSTLAVTTLAKRRVAYFNFEDEKIPGEPDGDELISAMNTVYGPVDIYLFDEIQNMPRWEQFLNRIHRLGKNVVVTGSNSRLLSAELSSSLTGRHVAIELFPLSYQESLMRESATLQSFRSYLETGGFPEVLLSRIDSRNYLSALWDAVILKDIVQRHKVRTVGSLRDLLALCLANICSRFSHDSIARALQADLSAPTVKKFLRYAQDSYLLTELAMYHRKPRVRIKSERKIYTIDNGFFSSHKLGVLDDSSKLLENFVFVELWRRGNKPNLDLFFYKTANNLEVDFLIRKGHQASELIQVAYSLSGFETRRREIAALVKAAQELEVPRLTLVTMDEQGEEIVDGRKVDIVSAYQWSSYS